MSMLRILFAIVWLAGLLPGMAQATDADRFVAASRSQQAVLLEQWGAAPDSARVPLLLALQKENLYVDAGKHAFSRTGENYAALGAAEVPEGQAKAVRLTNRLRIAAATALATHQLVSDNVTLRLAAAKQLQRDAQPTMLAFMQQRLMAEQSDDVRQALNQAIARRT
jgi:urea transport system permease protein